MNQTPCCWCGSADLAPFSPAYLRCPTCETLVVAQMPGSSFAQVTDDEQDFYGREYWFSHMEKDLGFPNIKIRARSDLIERCLHWLRAVLKYKLPPGQVLELGSAHGGFVALLHRAGFDATGLELSPWVVQFARKTFDIPMLLGPVEDQQIRPASLDMIALMDVLEHLPDPVGTMRHCLELLKSNGILVIQTPCLPEGKSYEDMVAQRHPFLGLLKEKEHLYLFSQRSIREFFGRLGVDHFAFEPAIFACYDMFLFVSRAPLAVYPPAQVERVVSAAPSGRVVQALLDLDALYRDLKRNYAEAQAAWAARLAVVEQQRAEIRQLQVEGYRRLGERRELQARLGRFEAGRNDLRGQLADVQGRFEVDEVRAALEGRQQGSATAAPSPGDQSVRQVDSAVSVLPLTRDSSIVPRRRRIVIDGVIFQLQAQRPLGISRIWRTLIPELVAALPDHLIVILRRSGYPVGIAGVTEREIPPYRLGPSSVLDADDAMLAQVCAEESADVFLSTYYTRAPGFRNVLMAYDLIPEVMGFDLSQPEWLSKQRAIAIAGAFIAISCSTRDDLIRFYGIPADRITIAQCGVSSGFRPVEQQQIEQFSRSHDIRLPYFVLAGNRGLYKNCGSFFRAFASLPERHRLAILAFGGEQHLLAEEVPLAQGLNVISIPWLPDDELAAAYSGALALVYPSRYEGFGLPVLEAMACGCPVITARNSSLPEVGGEAVLYADPDSPEEISAALREVLKPDARAGLASRGIDRARGFTWRGMAQGVARAIVATEASAVVTHATHPAPLVSAIVSAYNSERFIRGCLDDLERQTIADRLEIVVVNSGSAQNEDRIIREYMERYDNIVYIKTEQRETVYGAWNRGIKAARGRYMTNANTDDRHSRDALEVLARTLDERPDITLVYADCLITRTENETFETAHPTGMFRWLDYDRLALFNGCFIGPQPMWRREVHDEYGYFDESFTSAGDYEFWLRISRTRQFLHVKKTLGLYLLSPTGIEHGDIQKSIRESMQARARHYASIAVESSAALPPWPEEVVVQVRLADEKFGQGDLTAACESLRQALAIVPNDPQLILAYGNVILRLGDLDGARREFLKAATMHPTHGPSHLNLAAVLVMLERRDEAERSVRRALELNLNDPDALKLLGRLCVDSGRYDEGVKAYSAALSSNPSDIEALLMLGRCACERGDPETARVMYQRVLQIEPDNAVAVELLAAVKGQATAANPLSGKGSGMNRPIVSVIVPTFNRPDTLIDTLQSILTQTFQDFEIIVVNDGGCDVESIVRFLDKDDRITYIRHGSNRDRAAARNTAIKVARGKYLAYLDDDDLYYPDHLQTLVTCLQQGGQKVAYTDAYRAHQEKRDGRYVVTGRDIPYSIDFDHDRILVHNFIPILCLMHERGCLDAVGLFDESLTTHEDWELLIRLSRRFQFAHIKKVTCEFASRTDGSTTTSSKLSDFRRTYAIILERYKASAAEKPHIRAAQEKLLQSLRWETASTDVATQPAWPAEVIEQVRQAEQYVAQGDLLAAAQALSQALQLVPHDPELIVAHGNVLLRLGDAEGARREFVKATALSQEYVPAHSNLAAVLLHLGRAEEAAASAKRALALNAGDTDALKVLARVCLDNERYTEAVQAYVAILRQNPNDVETLLVVGNCYAEAGRPEDAKTFYKRVLQLDPQHAVAAENLAIVEGGGLRSPDDLQLANGVSVHTPLPDIRTDHQPECGDHWWQEVREPSALAQQAEKGAEQINAVILANGHGLAPLWPSLVQHTNHPLAISILSSTGNGNGADSAHEPACPEGWQIRACDLSGVQRLNQLLQSSSDDPVIVLSSNLVLTPGWLKRLLAALTRDQKLAAVGPTSNQGAAAQRVKADYKGTGKALRQFALRRAHRYGEELAAVDSLAPFCIVFKSSVCRSIGPLREDCDLVASLHDYFARLREAGHTVAVALDAYVHSELLARALECEVLL